MENKSKIWYGGFAFMKAFIFKHPINQLTEKYFNTSKQRILRMKAASTAIAWNSSYYFKSFSLLNNVWIDRPLMPSSDFTHYPKTG